MRIALFPPPFPKTIERYYLFYCSTVDKSLMTKHRSSSTGMIRILILESGAACPSSRVRASPGNWFHEQRISKECDNFLPRELVCRLTRFSSNLHRRYSFQERIVRLIFAAPCWNAALDAFGVQSTFVKKPCPECLPCCVAVPMFVCGIYARIE